MCGFIHSTFVTLPVNVTGLFGSNSAEMEWCAPAAPQKSTTAAATSHNDALRVIDLLLTCPRLPDTARP